MTFVVSSQVFLFTSVLLFGVGYTLLMYSKDGDMKNRSSGLRSVYADSKITTSEEAWDHLKILADSQLVEVTWNVFMFVAIISTFAFLGLSDYIVILTNSRKSIGFVALLFVLIVFSLQDLVHKWRNAHRRHPLLKEMHDIMERLQRDRYNTKS